MTGYWTCICGKVHKIEGKPIHCIGPGHSVYLAPAWFTYKVKEEKTKNEISQLNIFK